MKEKSNKGVLVAVAKKGENDNVVEEHLDELAFLALTADITTEKVFIQKLEQPDTRTFIGKGKLEDVKAYVVAREIDMVIFDDDLSPSQLRNLERELKCQIYDRSLLILDIFLNRAQTAQAKTQVELARYQYLMPRLTRMWTHLERQRGGTGTRGGAGEKEIETDRRNIRNQISVLKKKLEKIEKQNAVQRKSRSNIVRVALVGYTNVGKSTLMRVLSKSDVKAEDKLFATVDATVRKVMLNHIPFLLSDTVGFIRKLPHHLIESFKSTLAEVREADILLHVVDISHPAYEDHIRVVKETLRDIDATDKPIIYVFNKIDLLEPEEDGEPVEKMHSVHIEQGDEKVFISAEKGINIGGLKEMLFKKIKKRHNQIYPNYLKDEYYSG
ncbi:GTP-binding protein HflX [Fulvivirga imtechensis AK7]|uniref:GTPase HflX n=1 Tax=Fulvivirga imtechensis AK7 TaxID=1237149 RepID=L8JSG7_9BACT|nr:GTPase HflX [Fulvivirga imtechensis]ELR71780.1 GTP-binding protein HflX [Fulvivirga imtechensis AK7]